MGNQKEGFFTRKDSVCYTGTHLLLELWRAKYLYPRKYIEKALASAVKVAKATLLEIRPHHFSPNKGISGRATISESHINIHFYIGRIFRIIFASKKTDPQSVDFVSVLSKYKKFCRNIKYYNPKINFCLFIPLQNEIL